MKRSMRVCALVLALLTALCAGGCAAGGPDPEKHLEAARKKLENCPSMETSLDAEISLSAMGTVMTLTVSADTVVFADPVARKTETRAALTGALNEYAAHYAQTEGEDVAVHTFRADAGWVREDWGREEYLEAHPLPEAGAVLALRTGASSGLTAAEDELRGDPVIRLEGILAADAARHVLLTYGLVDGLTSALDAEMAAAVIESVTEQDKVIPAVVYLAAEDDTLLRAELDLTPLMKGIVNKVLSYMGDPALAALLKVGDCTVVIDYDDLGDADPFTLPRGATDPY